VDDLASQVDEIHISVLHEVRSKQRKSRKGALWLARAQTNAPSFESVLLDRGHELLTSNDGARSERGKAGEQRAPFKEHRLMVDHRAACDGWACCCLVPYRSAAARTTRSRFTILDMLQITRESAKDQFSA